MRRVKTALSLIFLTVALVLLSETGTTHSSAPADEQFIALTGGSPATLELSSGQTRIVGLAAKAQQYAVVSISKGDLNLSLSVQDPDGRTILEYSSYSYEPVAVAFITGPAGTYRLKFHSLERASANRRLEISLTALRPSAPGDAANATASQAFATATQARAQWTSSSLHAASEKYKEAAATWRSRGEWSPAAQALAKAAEVHFILGEYRQALDHYQQAITSSQKARDFGLESLYLSQAARLHSLLGATDAARQFIDRSLKYYSQIEIPSAPDNTKHNYAAVLSNVAEVRYATGDLMRADNLLDQSAKLLTETGDRDGLARTRLFSGYVSVTIGDRERAMTQFTEALASFREVNDRAGEGLALTAIGTGRSFRRQDEAAIKLHREAREIFRLIGDRESEAITLNGVAQAYQDLNDYDLALKHYNEALEQFQQSGSVDFATVNLCQIGAVYNASGNPTQALAYYEKCARASRAAGKMRILAYALDLLAPIYAKNGRRTEALAQCNALLKFYERINDRRGQVLTLNNLGDVYLASGDKAKALEFYNRALPLSKQAGESGVELSTLYNLAKAEQAAGMLDAALDHIKQSIDLIEGLRSNLASPNLRSAYFAGQKPHYDLYIGLLMQLDRERPGKGYVATALLASENSRARSLREMLAELGTDIRQGLDEATLKRERELQQLLSAQAQDQPALKDKEQATKPASDLDLLRAEYEELQAKIRYHNPNYETLLQPPPLTIAEIQSMLGANTLLLEYSLGPEHSYLWAVTNNSLNGYELPAKTTLEPAVLELNKLLTARQHVEGSLDQGYQARVEAADDQYPEKAYNLSRMLFAPVADRLEEKRIVVVAEGALQYTPFDALPLPSSEPLQVAALDQPMISKHEIAILPSVSTLAAIRADRRPRNTSSKLVAVFADPVFTASDDRLRANPNPNDHQIVAAEYLPGQSWSGLSRLAHTSEEAEAIRRAAGADTWIAEGFAATRENAISELLEKYKIVHFATHGLINAEHPELSGIVLSMLNPDGSSQNGFLQLHDIYRLRLTADLTMLSACNTALGKDVKGEGLIGLTRGFMYAGSRSVVASLWEVDDRATAVLMEHFYSALLRDHLTPAAALRSAKDAVRKQPGWQHPYYWAGFVLQGEYSEPITTKPGLSRLTKIVILMAALAAVAFLLTKFRSRLKRS